MKKILIVEDSRIVISILKNAFNKNSNLSVTTASSYAEATEVLSECPERFFLAILDYNLPDSSDGQAIDYVLSKKVPVIVLSGSSNKTIYKKIWTKRIIDFVLKDENFNINYLLSLINRLQTNSSVKIMIVDDSTVQRMRFRYLLENHFYDVIEAENGLDALNKLEENPDVKLLLTDFNMPKMDGIKLLRSIRKKQSKQELAIIGVSSTDDLSITTKFIKNGANDFIQKLVSPEEFYCRITLNIEMVECFEQLRKHENAT